MKLYRLRLAIPGADYATPENPQHKTRDLCFVTYLFHSTPESSMLVWQPLLLLFIQILLGDVFRIASASRPGFRMIGDA
jgi:hypothetical protein